MPQAGFEIPSAILIDVYGDCMEREVGSNKGEELKEGFLGFA